MFRPLLPSAVLLLLFGCAGTANAATEAEIAVTRTTVDILLPVLAIVAVVLLALILKSMKIESKAGEMPWTALIFVILAFFLGTLATTLLPTGKWISDAIVKGFHGADTKAADKPAPSITASGDPQNPTYDAEKGTVTTDNLPPEGQEMFVYWKSATVPPTGSSGGKMYGRVKEAVIVAKDATDVKVVFGTADGSKMSAVTTAKKK